MVEGYVGLYLRLHVHCATTGAITATTIAAVATKTNVSYA